MPEIVEEEKALKVDNIITPDIWEGEENTLEHRAWLRAKAERDEQEKVDTQVPQIQEEEEKERRAEKYTFWEDQPNKPEDYVKKGDKWFFKEKKDRLSPKSGIKTGEDYTGNEIDITESSVGKHLRKYGLPTPKTGDDLTNEIFDIQDSVTEKDDRVIKTIADEHFNMSGFDRPKKLIGYSKTDQAQFDFTNTEEEDLKIHFCGSKSSCERYEQYVKYKKNGTFDVENVDQNLVHEKVNLRKKELTQQHIGNLSEEERKEALIMMPSIFGENKLNLQTESSREEDAKEFEELYGRPLVKTEKLKGKDGKMKTFIPPMKSDNVLYAKQDYKENLKLQEKYLNTSTKRFNKDKDAYLEQAKKYEKLSADLQEEQDLLETQFAEVQDVTADSPQADIDKYNELIGKYKKLKGKIDASGLDLQYTSLTETKAKLDNRVEDLLGMSEEFGNITMASEALGLDYSVGQRIALNLEKSFLGGGAMLGTSIMSGLANISASAVGFFEGADAKESIEDSKLYRAIKKDKALAVAYNEQIGDRMENELPMTMRAEDAGGENLTQYMGQLLGNNSPSILVAMASGGLASGLSMAAKKKAANLGASAFFTMSYGGKMSDMEISQKNAPQYIGFLKGQLEKTTDPFAKKQIEKKIAEQKNKLNFTQMQKSFSSLIYGGVEMYAEKLGTLSYVTKGSRYANVVGASAFKKGMAGAYSNIYNMGVEVLEETATQLAQNSVDKFYLKEDVSLFDGLDTDFLINTAFTSLAIQGPSMGMNSYNLVKSEFKSREEAAASRARANELLEIQDKLSRPTKLKAKAKKDLVARKREILQEAALEDVMTVQKAANMNRSEVEALFETNRLREKKLRELQELGTSGEQDRYAKKRKEQLTKEFQDLDQKRNSLLSKPQQRRLAKAKADITAQAKKDGNPDVDGKKSEAEHAYNLGKFEFNKSIAKELGAGDFQVFEAKNPFELEDRKDTQERLQKYVNEKVKQGKLSKADGQKVINAYTHGSNGVNFGDDIIVFEDNVRVNVAGGGLNAKIAAEAPMHELLHIQNKKAGIVKDGEVVEASKAATKGIEAKLKELNESGKITDEQMKFIAKRIAAYNIEAGGVDLEEQLNLIGDLKGAGIIPKNSFNGMYEIQSLLSSAVKFFNKDNQMFFPFDTTEDAFRYIDKFHTKAKKGALMLPPEEDEETSVVNMSIDMKGKVNALVPDTREGEAAMSQQEWKDKHADAAFAKIYDPKSDIGKTLRTMIRANAPTDVANFDMDNYVDGTLFELLPHVRNFNPTNDNLWAWVNSYKKVKGYNVLKRGDASTKEFGISLNEEGAPQIESSNTAEDAVNIKEREAQEAKEVQPRLVDNLPMNKKIEVTGVTDTYSNIVKNNLKTALAQSLPDIYAKKSKNKKVSPFVSAIKKYAGNRITGTQFATLSMMGRGGQALKNHLIDTKSTYLKGMTTTWLSKNFPEAVEKSVGGKVIKNEKGETVDFIPNFIKDWQGKKIDKEISAVHGTTSQAQIMRRNPQAVAAITDKKWVDNFVKENPKTGTLSPIQSKMEGFATQVAGELALEVLAEDVKNEGELFQIYKNKQIQLNKVVAENIANDLAKDIERGGVKMSLGFAGADQSSIEAFYKRINVFGKALARNSGDVNSVFTEVYGEEIFTEKKGLRDKVIKSLQKYVDDYNIYKQTYDRLDVKIDQTLSDYVVNEAAMSNFDATFKQHLGLGAGAIDYRDINQIDSAIKAVNKIAHIIGIEKADRFLRPVLSSSGKIGGTKYAWIPGEGYVFDAMFDQNKIDKLEKRLANAIKNKKPTKKILESIEKAKNKAENKLEDIRQGIFGGKTHWDERIAVGLPGWTPDYKNSISADASQTVGVDVSTPAKAKVNKDSAKANKEFLIELSDIFKDQIAKGEISLNDYGMIMKSFQGATSGPLFAAAHVAYTTSGPITSKSHIYEHVIPRDVISMYLADYVLGNTAKTDVKTLLNQFTVAIVPRVEAKKFDKFYLSSMPKDWLLGTDVLKRYFNVKTFGKINSPLIDVTTGKINPKSQAFADAYNKDHELNEQAEVIDKAVKTSRVVKESKGITVLDFDDTLATTKSGVRAKIPNPDGTPKPGRKVIFLAGGAGSGKGNVIGKLGLEDQGFKVVNSDISLEWLKKNNGLPENMNDFTKEQRSTLGSLQYQARGIAKRKMTKYQGNGNGVVVDGTGGSIKSMQNLVSQFEADGYDVSMMFVETSLPVALERNAARKERSLLDKIVEKNHESVQGNKDGFKKMFGDRFMEVNTDNLSQEDAMPIELTEQMNDFVSGYENRRLDAEEFANEGADILDQGGTFDFSEFNKVVEGETAPLFNKAMKLQNKFGNKDMFVLTARPAESAPAIFEFLKANGLNIPIENITGLANSTPESKALWMADKVADGYNDFYFADDALQNVQAVQNMLDQFDVKSKVQQAKIKFSLGMNKNFNDILESTTGVESQKQFSDAQAKIRGAKTKYNNLIPASAQDFAGLLYNFIGKGKQGEADMAFFKKALIDPFARGINEINASKQSAANDYKNLQKAFPEVKKDINKNIEGTNFTNDQAARVYLWNKAGFEVPGLSKRDLKTLVEHVESNPGLQAYADGVGLISKKVEGYGAPGDYWLAENITSDLLSDDATNETRADFLAEWQQNADTIFTPENLNKIEAIYGSKFREALEDILYRMKTGRNRPSGGGRLVNQYMNWINNSVGAIMFLNLRSAALQTISATNYINWSDNNPLKAGAAFANQPQFWKDFSMIFNSDYLKQRRSGNQRGINEAELSAAVAGAENKAKAALNYLLKKGFLPTQLADSFAISMGGASFYRNKTKKYVKEGMTQEQAEKQAFLDLQETTEVNQQSARPDMISQQQASPLGRLILAFQNTPMQYARIMDKAGRDIINGRGDIKTNVSKIIYYGVAQSILFGALQSALFASIGDDEEEDFDKKKERIINGMIDSALSGGGVGGKAIATTKNTVRTFLDQRDRGFNADHAYTLLQALSFSPPIGSKLRKIYASIQTDKFNKDVFLKRGFTLDNPIWGGVGNVIEGVTNAPLGRISNMMLQLDNVLDSRNETWQRLALALGWNTWDLGIKDPDIEAIKGEIKEEKKIESKKKAKIKREQKKKETEEANKAVIEENKKKSKKDGICSAISKGGKRCKSKAVNGGFCTVHEKAEQNETGIKSQCKKIKKGGKRCGMQTSNKSGYCYYHD